MFVDWTGNCAHVNSICYWELLRAILPICHSLIFPLWQRFSEVAQFLFTSPVNSQKTIYWDLPLLSIEWVAVSAHASLISLMPWARLIPGIDLCSWLSPILNSLWNILVEPRSALWRASIWVQNIQVLFLRDPLKLFVDTSHVSFLDLLKLRYKWTHVSKSHLSFFICFTKPYFLFCLLF